MKPKTEKQEKVKNTDRLWTALLSILIVLLLLFWVLCGLMFSDPNGGSVGTAAAIQNGDLLKKLAGAVVGGTPARLSEEEVNGLLQQAVKNLPQDSALKIQAVNLTIVEEEHIELYAPVRFKGAKLGIAVRASLGFENGSDHPVWMQVESLKLGRLPVSPKLALWLLKDQLPAGVIGDGDTLRFDASFFTVKLPNTETPVLSLSSLAVKDGSFEVGMTGDAAALEKYLLDSLKSFGAILGL